MARSNASILKRSLWALVLGLLTANPSVAGDHSEWRMQKTACSRTAEFQLARDAFEKASVLFGASHYRAADHVLDKGIAALGDFYQNAWKDSLLMDDTGQALTGTIYAKLHGKMRMSASLKLNVLEDRLDLCSTTLAHPALHHAIVM